MRFILLLLLSSSFIACTSLTVSEMKYGPFKNSLDLEEKKESLVSLDSITSQELDEFELTQEVYLSQSSLLRKRPSVPILRSRTKQVIVKLNLSYNQYLYDHWIKFFTGRGKKSFVSHIENSLEYKNIISEIFREHGVPEDLFYVGLIESGYNLKVHSRAKAAGPWQFMPGTARNYGLRVDSSVDERYNIFKATHAAARYFKDLYNIFGSWELALCAYNAGEYGIINRIRRGNTRDYRELVKKDLLPKETVSYVPKVVAAREIFLNPTRYNMRWSSHKKKTSDLFEEAFSRNLNGHFDLRDIAKSTGVSLSTLKKLNPDLKKQRVTVRAKRQHELFFPGDIRSILDRDSSKLKRAIASFNPKKDFKRTQSLKKKTTKKVAKKSPSLKKKIHVVRRGENLSIIARKYKVTPKKLMSLNKLKNAKIYPRQELRVL